MDQLRPLRCGHQTKENDNPGSGGHSIATSRPCSGTSWAEALLTSRPTQALRHARPDSQQCQKMTLPTNARIPPLGLLSSVAVVFACHWAGISTRTWLHALVGKHQPWDQLDPHSIHTLTTIKPRLLNEAGPGNHLNRGQPHMPGHPEWSDFHN